MRTDDATDVIGTDAARIAELRRGQLKRFSLEALIRCLTRLDPRAKLHTINARPELFALRR